MRGKRLALSLTLLLASSLPACNRSRTVEAAREDRPVTWTAAEQDFLTKAFEANLAEMDVARIALAKSTNKDVKDYATMIRKDHKIALEGLTDLMADKDVPQQRTLVEETQRDINRMSTLK